MAAGSERGELHSMPGEHKYDGVLYCESMTAETLDKIKGMELYPEDILLPTYPKAGSAWICAIVGHIMDGGNEKHGKLPILEITHPGLPPIIDTVIEKPAGRVIATHLLPVFFARHLVTKRPKVVVLLRNPKDVLVSFYHFYRGNPSLGKFTGSFSEFFELFKANHLCYGDFFDFVLAWWHYKDEPNFLFITYEDLKRDPAEGIRKIANHLGRDLTDERMAQIVEQTSFDVMKQDPRFSEEKDSSEAYMRKGIVGDWREYLSDEQSAYIDNMCQLKLTCAGLKFVFG